MMLDLKVIIGSTRPGRAADRVMPWITAAARAHGEFGVDVIDLRDWELPIFGETFATVGDPRNPAFSVPVVKQILLDDLAWWGTALQQGRSRGTLPPAIVRLMAGHETGK